MSTPQRDPQTIEQENAELRARLHEADETLRAIRGGEVDALVIGDQVYTLESADAASNRFRGEVLAQINEVVIAVDNDMRVTYLNPAAEKLYDVTASDALGFELNKIYEFSWHSPEDETSAYAQLEEDGFWRGENIHILPGGRRIHVESTVSMLRDRDGERSGMLSVIRNINDRKQAEEALKASQERLQKALSIETVGILFFDMEGTFTDANQAFLNLSQYTLAEVRSGSLSWKDLTPEEWTQRSEEAFSELRATGRTTPYEKEYIRKDGSRFWGLFAASLLDEREAVEYVLDITSRKMAEDALLEAHNQLETRVQQRTEQLASTNSALQVEMEQHRLAEMQKRELLQKVVTTQEDERRRIARNIHDLLGQRVTALRLQLASISDVVGPGGTVGPRLERLQEVAERLDAEVGFLAWELRPAVLDDLGLPEAANAFVAEWSQHYEIPAELHVAGFTDRRLEAEIETHLYRIMQESLNNIVKHAGASEVTVLLKWADDGVALIVEDDGNGFDPVAEASARTAGKGLGLLGMMERASLIGGSVEIESTAGSGTTIYARAPAKPR
jgi:PAS domain S-box-containing protein